MNKQQIAHFVETYMQATQSQIMERSPHHLVVKLSPEADKALTGRSYYWSFIERTGSEPETMCFHFQFDEEKSSEQHAQSNHQQDNILGRYFGVTPTVVQYAPGQPRKEKITFGCQRLEQMFQAAKQGGRMINLYELPSDFSELRSSAPLQYTTWLCVNYKVSFICELKRDELHSLGISMSTGEIATSFHEHVQNKSLSPKLPPHTHVKPTISISRAIQELEKWIENTVRSYDHSWAKLASERLNEELAQLDLYYENLKQTAKEETDLQSIQEQHESRRSELIWQHSPRIQTSVVNCGFFHLFTDSLDFHR